MKKKHYRTVFISDIHLGIKESKAHELGILLDSVSCDYLVLLGDIIDGWRLSNKYYWPDTHNEIMRKILKKAHKGTKVIYIPGNHDEVLKNHLFELGNISIREPFAFELSNGIPVYLTHGDEFDQVVKYHKWVAYLGDWLYGVLLSANRAYNYVSTRVFNRSYWSLSQYLKRQAKEAINFIYGFEDAVAYAAMNKGYEVVVCGHIHHPVIKQHKGVLYCNTGDWVESLSYITEDFEGNLALEYFTN